MCNTSMIWQQTWRGSETGGVHVRGGRGSFTLSTRCNVAKRAVLVHPAGTTLHSTAALCWAPRPRFQRTPLEEMRWTRTPRSRINPLASRAGETAASLLQHTQRGPSAGAAAARVRSGSVTANRLKPTGGVHGVLTMWHRHSSARLQKQPRHSRCPHFQRSNEIAACTTYAATGSTEESSAAAGDSSVAVGMQAMSAADPSVPCNVLNTLDCTFLNLLSLNGSVAPMLPTWWIPSQL